MDELIVSGKKYISSKRAHELTGYAKDYIGQLARGGKLVAMRVGRAWYVEEASVLALAGNMQPAAAQEEVVPAPDPDPVPVSDPETVPEKVSAPQEEPRKFSPLPAASIPAKPVLKPSFYQPYGFPTTWGDIKYIEDTGELLPIIEKTPRAEEPRTFSSASQVAQETVTVPTRSAALAQPTVMPRVQRMSSVANHTFDIPKPVSHHVTTPKAYAQYAPAPVVRKKNSHGLVPISVLALMVLLALALSGIILPSQDSYSAGAGSQAANVFEALQPIWQGIWDSGVLQLGIGALRSFVEIIAVSFFDFLNQGFVFLKSLFSLTIGNGLV